MPFLHILTYSEPQEVPFLVIQQRIVPYPDDEVRTRLPHRWGNLEGSIIVLQIY
jgi:hypothetical protein